MATWGTPPSFSVGSDATSQQMNTMAGDLSVLAQGITLAGAGTTVVAGTLSGWSSATPGNAIIQCGATNFSYTSGTNSTLTFPVTFPNALISAVCTRLGTTSPPEFIVLTSSSCTTSTLAWHVYTNNNTEATSGSKAMSWIAIGW